MGGKIPHAGPVSAPLSRIQPPRFTRWLDRMVCLSVPADRLCAEIISRLVSMGATAISLSPPAPVVTAIPELQNILCMCRANDVWLVIEDDPVLCLALDADALLLTGTATEEDLPAAQAALPAHIRVGVLTPDIGAYLKKSIARPDFYLTCLPRHTSEGKTPVYHPDTPDPVGYAASAAHGFEKKRQQPPRPFLPCWSGEFDLIRDLLKTAGSVSGPHPSLPVPAGDDAALVRPLACPVISTDSQREQVHFRLDWQTLEEIGFKAVVAALSDLAASFADPVALFINLTLPRAFSVVQAKKLYTGITRALEHYACRLGGGNVSSGNRLGLDLFVIGEGRQQQPPHRGGARIGDQVCVTGPIGLARAGLCCLENEIPGFPELVHAFKTPTARFDAAKMLETAGVTCVMDISDGLAGDASHMARAAGLTIALSIAGKDIPPALTRFAACTAKDPRDLMLAGGEDYELLFTCLPEALPEIRRQLPEVFPVGVCMPYTGQPVSGLGNAPGSWDHGRKP
ncbi:MAG: thiamine-phosphate kinase [Deltaproteobacteria bacterium]|nr:MAG: thiamine-phosphate kinase [Deltaproteobacteria bacterium]